MSQETPPRDGVRIALEGCGHGKLHDIYSKVTESAAAKGWTGVDLVIIGGDFQSVRNTHDLSGMSVPVKYRQIGDFHEYYSGKRIAPYLTIFIGGNHEASNYLFELYYGGWVAPNIYYLGAANVLRFGPLRIAGLSGIWKGYDYNKPHFERLPYNEDDVKTIYHTRELDVRKLMQIRTQVDIGLSHDWPRGVELHGDHEHLFRVKRGFREDSESGKLGSTAAKYVLDRLRPRYWFSAHLHVRYAALVPHGEYVHPKASRMANKQPRRFPQGFDGSSDLAPSSFEPPNTNLVPQEKNPEDNLMAWNNFGNVAAKQDAEENEKFLQERSQPGENHSLDVDSISCTFRKIQADDPNRKVIAIEKNNAVAEGTIVKNTDEIDLDLDSDDEGTSHKMDVDSEVKAEVTNTIQLSQATEPVKAPLTEDSEGVSESVREQLPEGFKRQQPEPAVYGPLPDAISNTKTQFLALGKCEEHRDCSDYLELMEIFPSSEETEIQRPYELQYDKEWLALSRVLDRNLTIGDPSSQVPSDLGNEKYKVDIEEAEAWVQEHIVDKGKITIPQNFEITAPVYDSEVPIDITDMPPEYNNPQTAAFCELLGIENKFYLSPIEREQRMIAGPRPSNNVRPSYGNGRWHRRGRDFSGRGNRGGRGRGGRGRGGFRHGQNKPF